MAPRSLLEFHCSLIISQDVKRFLFPSVRGNWFPCCALPQCLSDASFTFTSPSRSHLRGNQAKVGLSGFHTASQQGDNHDYIPHSPSSSYFYLVFLIIIGSSGNWIFFPLLFPVTRITLLPPTPELIPRRWERFSVVVFSSM